MFRPRTPALALRRLRALQHYRITEYRMWDGANLQGRWDLPANATELYDHRPNATTLVQEEQDPFASESVNVADDAEMTSVLVELRAQLRLRFASSSHP